MDCHSGHAAKYHENSHGLAHDCFNGLSAWSCHGHGTELRIGRRPRRRLKTPQCPAAGSPPPPAAAQMEKDRPCELLNLSTTSAIGPPEPSTVQSRTDDLWSRFPASSKKKRFKEWWFSGIRPVATFFCRLCAFVLHPTARGGRTSSGAYGFQGTPPSVIVRAVGVHLRNVETR